MIKPEVAQPTSCCPHPERWKCYDDMATEIEVLDFLHALVLMLKPEVVVETGCYHGYGTERLARACEINGFGHVHTCDVQSQAVELSRERVGTLPATIHACTGIELIESVPPIDFLFIDSAGADDVRCEELRRAVSRLNPSGVIAIHDTGLHTSLREFHLPNLVRSLGLQYIFFDTPRGLTLVRKQPEVYP